MYKEKLVDAEHAMMERTKEAARATDEYVHDHPWQAVGVAAGVGLVIGVSLFVFALYYDAGRSVGERPEPLNVEGKGHVQWWCKRATTGSRRKCLSAAHGGTRKPRLACASARIGA